MSENEIHKWMIECFGPIQGEMLWKNFNEQVPDFIREEIMNQGPGGLPDPAQMRAMMSAFASGEMAGAANIQDTLDEGPINKRLAMNLAAEKIREGGAAGIVSAQEAQEARDAMSQANLWLDAVTDFNPPSQTPEALTREQWVEKILPQWIKIASPVADSMNRAMADVFTERLGEMTDGKISGIFAGPISIPVPEDLNDTSKIFKLLGNTSYAIHMGEAAGNLAAEVRGSFDQGIALTDNPAGALIVQNADAYAAELDIDKTEVRNFLALIEAAHARLFASVPWLMPRFEALISKYAREIKIDLDAMEEQLREAENIDPSSISAAVNLSQVAMRDTDEQKHALATLETMMTLTESWVDCVTWRAGMPYLPHIEQLREMRRRERAIGGPAEHTFEALLGLSLQPKTLREAAEKWEEITAKEGTKARDKMWSHPDLLLPIENEIRASGKDSDAISASDADSVSNAGSSLESSLTKNADSAADSNSKETLSGNSNDSGEVSGSNSQPAGEKNKPRGVDWDSELSKLLERETDAGLGISSDDSSDSDNAGNTDGTGKTDNADDTENADGTDNDSTDNDGDRNE